MRKSLDERFWGKVNKSEPCWLWTGVTDSFGYGSFWLIRAKKRIQAHRFSWMQFHGDIPPGLCCCHMCDNPLCVNPSHLYLGTKDDNLRDAHNKRRHAHGERMGSAKLRESEVLKIRELAPMMRLYKLMLLFPHVHRATIQDIISRKTWKHL